MSSIAAPMYSRYAEKRDQSQAKMAGISIRCALEAYNIRESNYPRTLANLVPDYIAELPADPFSGNDFHYELRTVDGQETYLLYSVGPDGDDDMGLVVWSPDDRDGDMLIGPVWTVFTARRE